MAEKHSKMSAFSLTMLALGSIIGAGMFLGSGLTIHMAGPSVILAYALLGILMYFNLSFLAELSLLDPEEGSFQTYASKAFGPGVGFIIGWLYWISGVLVMSSEVTAAAIFSTTWFPGFPQWIFVIVYAVILTAINLVGAGEFGKLESILAIIKVLAFAGFILLGAVLVFTSWLEPAVGWRNLFNSSFFSKGLSGFAGSLLLVFYAYAGTSVVGLAINESEKPEKTVPKVVLATTGLVTILYVVSIFFLLLLSPWTTYNGKTSPYVAVLSHNFSVAQHIMTFVILTAALSAMNASMYGVPRMLHALANQGEAPRFFIKQSKKKVPVRALLFSNAFLLGIAILSYFIPNQLYLLVTGASGLLSLTNVIIITLSHWKLRPALAKQHQGGKIFHALGFPYTNLLLIIVFGIIFISAFLIPSQRPSFILGLGLILMMTVVYFAVRRRLRPHTPESN